MRGSKGYQMSERAFIDVWEAYSKQGQITGSKQCTEFIEKLFDVTEGLFIVDHFSHTNYDNIIRVEYKEPFTILHWVDLEKNKPPRGFEEMMAFAYGNNTYIYSLCQIQKIKMIDIGGHLFVLVMPSITKVKEVKKILDIEGLQSKDLYIGENKEDLYTEIRFRREDRKIHQCILHDLPFYSFLLQPKEKNIDVGFSRFLLMEETLIEALIRIEKIKVRLDNMDQPDLDYDELNGCGNSLRIILEYVLKYYCIFFGYSLPTDHYSNNKLGNLKKHISSKGDELGEFLPQGIINTANEFSHDTGFLGELQEAFNLQASVQLLTEYIYNKIKESFSTYN